MVKHFRNTLKSLLFFPILIWINSCKNVDNSKFSNYFFYNEDQNITTLDPAFVKNQSEIWAVSQLFEGLVEYDDSLHIRPSLASSWEISDSGRIYLFHLRTDVYFHSTGILKDKRRKMTASDIVASFVRIADPATASPGAWIFNDKMDLRCFESPGQFVFPVNALDDSTVRIQLLQPFTPFLGILAMPYCFIVPHEAVNAEFRNHPIGTGPFMFRKWEEDVALLYGRNPDYYRFKDGQRLPFLDGVMIDNIRNRQTAFMKFTQGEYDFYNGIDASIKDELLTKSGELKDKYKERFDLKKSPWMNTEYIGFNIDPKFDAHPLNNLSVRKAIQFAIDREKMVLFLRNGVGTPAKYGFVPVGIPLYPYASLDAVNFNMDSALYYVRRSGIDFSKSAPIVLNTTSEYLEIMVFIQKELQNIGIPIKIEVHPSSFLRQLRKDQKINFFRGSWIADYPDAENYLVCFESRNFSPSGPNYFHYKNTAYDALLQKSNRLTNDTLRLQMLGKADKLMMQSVPCIILYYDQSVRMTRKWTKDLNANPINFLRLREVRKMK
jgi:oligopeptide transport system substrate-binding protein